MSEPLENLYFNWLCAKVMRVEVPTPSLTYWKLLTELHNTEFVWLLSGDDNRAEDGLELRPEFLLESNLEADPEWIHLGCSLFEMLLAFSRRAAFQTEESAQEWFMHFLENMGLAEFNDARNFTAAEVGEYLYTLVWRTYSYDGRGGLFPIKNPPHDQREVEIWYQFCEYLVDQER